MPASHSLGLPSRAHRGMRFIFATGAVLLLGACTSMRDIPPGTPLADVQARYGAPTVECPQPDGTRTLVWSTQPMGQYAWGSRVGADGRLGAVEQILTDAAFKQVEIGVWNEEQLLCAFGPPADKSMVGLPSVRQNVWSYRYRQAGAWNSLMHVYLSDTGVVQRMHPGPDPLYELPEWPLF